MGRLFRGVCSGLVLMVVATLGGVARGQETTADWGQSRVLGGQNFLTPTLVDSALILSTVDMRGSATTAKVTGFPVLLLGQTELNTATALGQAKLGVRVLPELELFGAGRSSVVSGTNPRTLLVQGASLQFGGEVGLAVRLFRLHASDTQLTLRGAVGAYRGRLIAPGNLVNHLQAAPRITVVDILDSGVANYLNTPTHMQQYQGALALAQPFSSMVALQASAGVVADHQTLSFYTPLVDPEVTVVNVRPNVAVALSIDGGAAHVPVAVMGEYRFVHQRSQDHSSGLVASSNQSEFAAGIFYSGRRDLQVGLEGLTALGYAVNLATPGEAEGQTGSSHSISGELVMTYFW